ncbi:MFS transporter [Pseudonocardia cypriaca]|uniref:MFS transporter n=1 Tax=Pseudonocardia cypriaca TaxID=882449 RepID=UPI00114F3CF9|nr:MFS transporter [Pseudonocardia cypriaca]
MQLVLGLPPLEAAAWTVPSALGYLLGSVLGPPIGRRVRPAFVIAAGLVLAALGFGLLTQVGAGPAVLVTGTVVFSVGLAPVYLLTTEMIVSAAPANRAGSASAISETGVELGGALGVAVLGSIGAAGYRYAMGAAAPPAVPPGLWVDARGTLGGAVAAAEQLPDGPAAQLVAAARAAYDTAFATVAAVGAGLLAVVAVAAAVALRGVRS